MKNTLGTLWANVLLKRRSISTFLTYVLFWALAIEVAKGVVLFVFITFYN
jgi:hypothetical protein